MLLRILESGLLHINKKTNTCILVSDRAIQSCKQCKWIDCVNIHLSRTSID